MLGVLITGGMAPPLRHADPWLRKAAHVVSADSGLDHAHAWGVEPDYIVGDMDSIADQGVLARYPDDRVLRMAEEKDYTDTEIGLQLLRRNGCEECVLLGGGGGRLDHLLGLLALFDRDDAPRAWLTHRDEVVLVDERFERTGLTGETISFFPVGLRRCRMRSHGLKWPLDDLVWTRGDVGISNEVVDDTVSVTMQEGRLIMVRQLEPGVGS